MTQQTSTVQSISLSIASATLTAQPDCTNLLTVLPECIKFSTDEEYRFDFTGNTTWKCLIPEKCGVPRDIYKPTQTEIPEQFLNPEIWQNQATVSKGLTIQSAPIEVLRALNNGGFTQCLGWSKGLSIPTLKWDQKKNIAIGSLAKLPYVCGSDKAFRVKDAVKAMMISPNDYKALPTA
jgi:hypothetical protein